MNNPPVWLPSLILLSDSQGNWKQYCDLIYGEFYKDFIQSQPRYDGQWVRCRLDPISLGKEAGFWHCISTGDDEDNRVPETPRCERIRWVRAVIENATDPQITSWPSKRGGETRRVIWLAEEYVVVLGERERKRDGVKYMQLITAYCSDRPHTIERLRRERDAA